MTLRNLHAPIVRPTPLSKQAAAIALWLATKNSIANDEGAWRALTHKLHGCIARGS
jgi:hypothetical protein